MNLANMQNQDWPKNRRTRRKMAMTLYEQKMATVKVVHQFSSSGSRRGKKILVVGKIAMGVKKSKWARAKIWNQWVRINLGEFQYPPQAPHCLYHSVAMDCLSWHDNNFLNCFAALVPIFSQWYNSFSVGPLSSFVSLGSSLVHKSNNPFTTFSVPSFIFLRSNHPSSLLRHCPAPSLVSPPLSPTHAT